MGLFTSSPSWVFTDVTSEQGEPFFPNFPATHPGQGCSKDTWPSSATWFRPCHVSPPLAWLLEQAQVG